MAHQIYQGILFVESLHFPRRETDATCSKQIVQMFRIGCTGYRSYPRFSRQHPHEGKLCTSHPLLLRPFTHLCNKRHIVPQRFRCELRQRCPAIRPCKKPILMDSSGQECTPQRTIRHKTNTQLFECRKYFCFRHSPPNGIFALHCRERTNSMCPANGSGACL